jgi:hypothetical protein
MDRIAFNATMERKKRLTLAALSDLLLNTPFGEPKHLQHPLGPGISEDWALFVNLTASHSSERSGEHPSPRRIGVFLFSVRIIR